MKAIDFSKFKTYEPNGRYPDDVEIMSLSGGRSSAYTLMMLLNGGFLNRNPKNIISFQNTGKEDETCLIFLKELEEAIGGGAALHGLNIPLRLNSSMNWFLVPSHTISSMKANTIT